MTNDRSGPYVVGYGKPPRQSRFKKGQSGNPSGRPKGSQGIAALLERALTERVVITENGKRRTISKLEASFKQLVNRAATGDLPAMRQLYGLFPWLEERLTDAGASGAASNVEDESALKRLRARLLDVAERVRDETKTDSA